MGAGFIHSIALGLLLGAFSPSAGSAQPDGLWQLTLSYDRQELILVEAKPIPSTAKAVRTPGLEGAPLQLDYVIEWLDDAGDVLVRAPVTVPLGLRVVPVAGASPLFGDAEMPASGVFVLRVGGPANTAEVQGIRLVKDGAGSEPAAGARPGQPDAPAAFAMNEHRLPWEMAPQARLATAQSPGPVSSSKVRDTGPDQNRLVIVVMGDGYTAGELAAGAFSNQVRRFFDHFFAVSPWSAYGNVVNVYRIDLVSNQSGADYEDKSPSAGGTVKDTYLDAQFWAGGSERCVYLSGSGIGRALAAADSLVGAGVWDEILVFVNSTKYGGSGGAVGVTSVNPASDEIQVHEFGHSFAGLADEYDYGISSTNCVETVLRNVDCGFRFPEVKWDAWVEPGTPIPTPKTSTYADLVGAFAGALYQAEGVYRPMLDCKMRSLSASFCRVCQEGHVLKLFERIDLLDGASPPFGFVGVSTNVPRVFTVNPIPVSELSYRWLLAGKELAGETNVSVSISSAEVTSANVELRLVVTHSTPLVRAQPIQRSYAWRLNVVDSPSLAAADAIVTEGDQGTAHAVMTVTLSFPSTNTVRADYASVEGTAVGGVDYLPVAGELVFPPGNLTQTVMVPVLGDRLPEPDEVFFVNLSNPRHGTLGDRQIGVAINDNDNPPTVTLSSPTDGAVFSEGETVFVGASAWEAHGRIALVEVFASGSRLFGLETEPHRTSWTNVPSGFHTLLAVATDSSGRTATSAPVRITVLRGAERHFALVSLTNAWKFDATTNDYGNLWKDASFDDSGWRGPSAALFYSGNLPLAGPKNTPVSLVYNGARIRGVYYRTHFVFPEPPAPGLTLVASNVVVDGAVFYLNGAEAARLRMPDGTITRTNLALRSGLGTQVDVLELPSGSLVQGDNLLSVEVHPAYVGSVMAFGMSLDGLVGFAPRLTDVSEPGDRLVEQGKATTLTVFVAGTAPVYYQWFRQGNPVVGATNQDFVIDRMTLDAAGDYFCQVSNSLGVAESRVASVGYVPDRAAPFPFRAVRTLSLTNLVVAFSEAIDPTSATSATNYEVLPISGEPGLLLSQARLTNGTNVILTTSLPDTDRDYLLAVRGVRDLFGNAGPGRWLTPMDREISLIAGDQQRWTYFQSVSDPGRGWWSPSFDDTQDPWASGPALFHANGQTTPATLGPDNEPVRWTLNLTNPPGADQLTIAYYFRASFNLPMVRPGTRLQLRALANDGAAFYLNGAEGLRLGLPPGPVPLAYGQLALRTQQESQCVYEGPFELPADSLREGANILAAEVHQATGPNADVSFAAQLIAVLPGITPSLQIARTANSAVISWSGFANALLQEADDPRGPWHDVSAANGSYAVPISSPRQFFRLLVR